MAKSKTSLNSVLRGLPSVSDLLASRTGREIASAAGESHAAALSRKIVDELRQEIVAGSSFKTLADEAEERLSGAWQSEELKGIRRVINATGVVIHTNLGRSCLPDGAREAIADAAGYCTLEYDIETGKRGARGPRAEQLLIELTGAEDVLIVNNCAAAAFFVLTAFAGGGEVELPSRHALQVECWDARSLEQIGRANRDRGFKPLGWKEFWRGYRREKELTPLYPATD